LPFKGKKMPLGNQLKGAKRGTPEDVQADMFIYSNQRTAESP